MPHINRRNFYVVYAQVFPYYATPARKKNSRADEKAWPWSCSFCPGHTNPSGHGQALTVVRHCNDLDHKGCLLTGLPTELQYKVFAFLPPITLVNLSRTCKRFQISLSFENCNRVWYDSLPSALLAVGEQFQFNGRRGPRTSCTPRDNDAGTVHG